MNTTEHRPQPLPEAPPVQTGRNRSTRRAHGWIRALLPAVLILVWLIGAGIGGPYFGKVSEVSSNDQTSYLPESAEATQVHQLQPEFSDVDAIPAVVVITSETVITDAQQETLATALDSITGSRGIASDISPLILSDDKKAAQVFVPIDSDAGLVDTVAHIEDTLAQQLDEGMNAFVTGPAGFTADLVQAFAGIDGLLLVVALAAVFLILIIVYRSLLLPIAVLSTSMFALTVALLTVWWLAKAGIFLLSGQTQGILFILVIGAATDYSLLYVSRYREALRIEHDRGAATRQALRGAWEPIVASGGTVIVGLLCLLFSDLKSNSTLGPVASVGIIFAMMSALTLLPSILFFFGRAAFWPRRPRFEPDVVRAENGVAQHGLWARVGSLVRQHPRAVWSVTAVVLIIGALGVTQLQAQGVAQSELVLGASQAREGQAALGKHFAGGSGSPVVVVAEAENMQNVANTLLDHDGIDSVSVISADSPSGTAPVTSDGIQALGPPGTPAPDPTTVDGRIMLQATLNAAADSVAAENVVRDVRAELAHQHPETLVGGVTATAIDTNDASIRDRTVIIPIVLVVILLILMLLLRAIVAPILLIATTVVSFATALGVAALVFNDVFQFAGADPAVPLFSFVFLVALGIDYNIFLTTRVREESLHHGTRDGIIRGLSVTGGVITSAGLVLAATFAALSVIPILFLVQIAFIVAFGVLLDTFLVRALLVPALMYDIGSRVWWPSALGRSTDRGRSSARSGAKNKS
ncbi:MMPL family transporter [Microbacterium sp. YY-01]|uniref:MMPL family transporter n=1 Tax=Microbacterium sp. YY-01 TaxID=3421634 RepID=UPI003D179BFD